MKKNFLMVLTLTLFGLPLLAIAAPNFSGSWVRDSAQSEALPNQFWLTRTAPGGGRGGGGRGPGAEVIMTVQQDASSLQVTEAQGAVRKYKLDGKPATNITETQMEKASVTASVQGDTLLIGTTQPYGGMPGNVTLEVKEVWSLSADGKTLTITTTRTAPAATKTFKQVYHKK